MYDLWGSTISNDKTSLLTVLPYGILDVCHIHTLLAEHLLHIQLVTHYFYLNHCCGVIVTKVQSIYRVFKRMGIQWIKDHLGITQSLPQILLTQSIDGPPP